MASDEEKEQMEERASLRARRDQLDSLQKSLIPVLILALIASSSPPFFQTSTELVRQTALFSFSALSVSF
jgi:hypothetical protein